MNECTEEITEKKYTRITRSDPRCIILKLESDASLESLTGDNQYTTRAEVEVRKCTGMTSTQQEQKWKYLVSVHKFFFEIPQRGLLITKCWASLHLLKWL
jgi:hypothetical protein